MKTYKIPFDGNGNMVSYEGYGVKEMRDNYEFTGSLRLVAMHRGRSACDFEFQDTKGKAYSMFFGEFRKIIEKFNAGIIDDLGTIYGTWTFRKQGANYSITLKDSSSQASQTQMKDGESNGN